MFKNVLIPFVVLIALSLFVTVDDVRAVGQDVIPDSYIVVFKDSVASPESVASEIALQHGLSVAHTYRHALKGFSANIPVGRLNALKKDPRILFISQDRQVSISAKPIPTPVPQPSQTTPTGVRRIGIATNTGNNIGVAVIDTGIDLDHPDLVGNVVAGYSCVRRNTTGNDDNGHGTHVAGTIAAMDNTIGVIGVAPDVDLYAVKVLDQRGSGSWSSVICGIDYVTAHANSIKIANMSLGGIGTSDNNCGDSNNDALHRAICNSTFAGVTYVVAAGNENDNAANHVPSAYDDTVITVSALADSDGSPGGTGPSTSYGADDTFASFSNYGSVVDIGAPGVSINSTWKDGAYKSISGTSMATPHVAGAAALYLSVHPGSNWTTIRDGLITTGETLTDPLGRHHEPILQVGSL